MLGSYLRTVRKQRGLRVVEVAERVGVARVTVYAWEAGDKRPSLPNLDALCDALALNAAQRSDVLRLAGAP